MRETTLLIVRLLLIVPFSGGLMACVSGAGPDQPDVPDIPGEAVIPPQEAVSEATFASLSAELDH